MSHTNIELVKALALNVEQAIDQMAGSRRKPGVCGIPFLGKFDILTIEAMYVCMFTDTQVRESAWDRSAFGVWEPATLN
jgi:hypothetical protein